MECILEDLARFYAALVRQTCDEKSREFLLRSKQAVNGRLDFLRHVALKEPASAAFLEEQSSRWDFSDDRSPGLFPGGLSR